MPKPPKTQTVADGTLQSATKKKKKPVGRNELPTLSGKKRGRPKNVPQAPAPSYPPPPPPPPPPANNPFYQKFFEDYWRNYSKGFQVPRPGGGVTLVPTGAPPPPAPIGAQRQLIAAPPMVLPPTPRDIPATRSGLLSQEEYPVKDDRVCYVLATPDDKNHLSEKQCYVRSRLCEIFLATKEDVESRIRGRKASFVGQVGLRCVFCVPALDAKHRVERAITYPTAASKFYQTAQDMQHFHYTTCPAIPFHIKEKSQGMKANMNARRGESVMSPKEFWTKCNEELGLIDHVGDDGSNVGVKLKEDHGLVPRSRLPEYAQELFLPPSNENLEMAKVLEEEKVDENKGGFDELVADLDEAKEDEKMEDNDDGEENEEEGEDEEEENDQEDGDGEEC